MRKYILLIVPFIYYLIIYIAYQKTKNPVGPIGNGTEIPTYTWIGIILASLVFIYAWYLSFRMFKKEIQQSKNKKVE